MSVVMTSEGFKRPQHIVDKNNYIESDYEGCCIKPKVVETNPTKFDCRFFYFEPNKMPDKQILITLDLLEGKIDVMGRVK